MESNSDFEVSVKCPDCDTVQQCSQMFLDNDFEKCIRCGKRLKPKDTLILPSTSESRSPS